MCWYVKEFEKCKGCNARPNCGMKIKRDWHLKGCPAQMAKQYHLCPNGGKPDKNNRNETKMEKLGDFTCTECEKCIALEEAQQGA